MTLDNMELPVIKPLKPAKFWNRPTLKHYGLRTHDVHRLYGDSYREYKNNKMDAQAQSFVDPIRTADMPSSWCNKYQEPKFLTDTYLSLRMPKGSKDTSAPAPRPSISSFTPSVITGKSVSVHQSSYSTTKYGHQYLGGVRSSQIGGSSSSYARLEERLAKI